MVEPRILVPEEAIADFCRHNGISKLSLFGSVLTNRFSDTSDVDILVEFDPDRQVGFLRLAAMERELSAVLGRRVDLRTPDELSRCFRADVLRTAHIQYVRE